MTESYCSTGSIELTLRFALMWGARQIHLYASNYHLHRYRVLRGCNKTTGTVVELLHSVQPHLGSWVNPICPPDVRPSSTPRIRVLLPKMCLG